MKTRNMHLKHGELEDSYMIGEFFNSRRDSITALVHENIQIGGVSEGISENPFPLTLTYTHELRNRS